MSKIAIININKCKPDRCNHECKTYCPIEQQKKECINIITDIEDAVNNKTRKYAKIIESSCIGCGQCVKKCPFDAIKIVKIPSEVTGKIIHRYNANGFRLYKMPVMKPNHILGLIGANGIGKSTVMQILTNKIQPNFEDFKTKLTFKQIIAQFKGTEMHKYMEKLYNNQLTISIKPQHVESLQKIVPEKTLVSDYIKSKSSFDNTDTWFLTVIETLQINEIINSDISVLSGGELQRLICATTLLKKADVYMFDEPSNYLDVRQRLNISNLIKQLSAPDKYVLVIEHDLTMIDYITDYICILYGTPSAFGVVSDPHTTAEAINIYFDGYIPSENMRFRTEEYNLSINSSENIIIAKTNDKLRYEYSQINFPNFELQITEGSFPTHSSITLVLGQNGIGKTTLINHFAAVFSSTVSYKPQYLSFDKFQEKNGTFPTVEAFLYNNIQKAMTDTMFRTDVLKPLQIDQIKDHKLNQLSGGEMQRLWITFCLGTPAYIYLIDEPSACLDIEQRVTVTKVIKRFILHNQKIAFVVEHDMMMAVSLAHSNEDNSQVIFIEKTNQHNEINKKICVANAPVSFSVGINQFLKSMNITFRTHIQNQRPRINKLGSVKDTEQKSSGKFYQ